MPPRRSGASKRLLAALGVSGLLAGCAPLAIFDTLAPYDAGGQRVARDLAYDARPRQRLDVYAPDDPAVRPAPVVVFIYGGAWSSGDKDDYGFLGRALAARGFVVVIPDYRLVPEVRYPAFVQDGAAAVAWTLRHVATYGGDPDRLVLAGHSAGAYNALMLALAPRFLEAAGVAAGRIDAVAGLAGPYDFLPLDHRSTLRAFAGVADLPATQPVNRVEADAPPVFLAAGDGDTTVAPRNSRALAGALAAKGVPVELRIYPGLGHAGLLLALSRPLRGRAPVLDDMTAFFRRRLGAASAPD